jgi:hypothetical protein
VIDWVHRQRRKRRGVVSTKHDWPIASVAYGYLPTALLLLTLFFLLLSPATSDKEEERNNPKHDGLFQLLTLSN